MAIIDGWGWFWISGAAVLIGIMVYSLIELKIKTSALIKMLKYSKDNKHIDVDIKKAFGLSDDEDEDKDEDD